MHSQYWLDGEGHWSGWQDISGTVRFDFDATPTAICRRPGLFEVFCRSTENLVHQANFQ